MRQLPPVIWHVSGPIPGRVGSARRIVPWMNASHASTASGEAMGPKTLVSFPDSQAAIAR